jgi:hypothetical protein
MASERNARQTRKNENSQTSDPQERWKNLDFSCADSGHRLSAGLYLSVKEQE